MSVALNSKLGNVSQGGGGGGGSANWGSIGGTLNNQADLAGRLSTLDASAGDAATALALANTAQPAFHANFANGLTSAQILAHAQNVLTWHSGYSADTPGVVARTQVFTWTPPAGGAQLSYTASFDNWGKLISLSAYS